MIKAKKKLIEVALPLDAINRACKDDKDRKTGHIRNLHKWYAPMPLPAWRAVLDCAQGTGRGPDGLVGLAGLRTELCPRHGLSGQARKPADDA